ncbi:signal peptidase I [Lysinibacillus sp. KU-BSD001]|uniref:signal peptidase I n=1 Tax=Lysinibacillus sp. KU-BSD001 TaxID=3141328 RepID=UPI0036E826E4
MDKNMIKKEIISWLNAIGAAILLTVVLRYFICTPILVDGASMLPTINSGDRVIVNKIGPKISQYDRFDVIVFRVDEDTNYIKRIIGLPGDHIEYKNDELFINGEKFEEHYLEGHKVALADEDILTEDFNLQECLEEEIVPEECYFVLGDNRKSSMDSRNERVGFVPREQIIGTVDVVVWPLHHLSFIQN